MPTTPCPPQPAARRPPPPAAPRPSSACSPSLSLSPQPHNPPALGPQPLAPPQPAAPHPSCPRPAALCHLPPPQPAAPVPAPLLSTAWTPGHAGAVCCESQNEKSAFGFVPVPILAPKSPGFRVRTKNVMLMRRLWKPLGTGCLGTQVPRGVPLPPLTSGWPNLPPSDFPWPWGPRSFQVAAP